MSPCLHWYVEGLAHHGIANYQYADLILTDSIAWIHTRAILFSLSPPGMLLSQSHSESPLKWTEILFESSLDDFGYETAV